MAPEVLAGKPFNEKADVYSFGIVLWEILTRKEPFEEFETFEEFRNAVCYHHVRPPIPPNTLPRLAALIEACWTADPARRPSFDQIIAQLDHIVVECAIQDEVGRKFWKRYFLKKVWGSCSCLLAYPMCSQANRDTLLTWWPRIGFRSVERLYRALFGVPQATIQLQLPVRRGAATADYAGATARCDRMATPGV